MALVRRLLSWVATALALTMATSAWAETRLLMAEEDGCMWCARWNEEVAPEYPKTAEGRAAPLHRFDLHDAPPEGITFTSRVRFTPTFVLVIDGTEVDRLEGYPGEDFFWGLLSMMLQRANVAVEGSG